MRERNKPATHAEVKQLGNPIGDTEMIADRVYANKYPNRQQRRQAATFKDSAHNNRATTKARKTQQHELKKAVITGRDAKGKPLFMLIATGVIKTIRVLKNWRWGGNTTHPARTR